MSEIAVSVSGLAKRFRIGASPVRRTFRESASEAVRSLLSIGARAQSGNSPEIWALDDVSFEVREGEVLGIIGRNGAGKSTLLRILARITEPTRGLAVLRGRVGALLEVGTGFHQELTGRENVFLSGSLLGMSRSEVRARFDEIVAFAEVERFLDTPVKRYSSGMFMRLAFAVAAHFEPEILIVDEVLSVGDARFQRRCLNKMEEAQRGGRTVLFVSHNMPTVARLCPRVILMEGGRVIDDGPCHKVVATYLGTTSGSGAAREWPRMEEAPGTEIVRLSAIRACAEDLAPVSVVDIRHRVGIELRFSVLVPGHVLIPNVHFFNEDGLCVFVSNELASPWYLKPRPPGRYRTTAWVPGNLLAEGRYFVAAAISRWSPSHHYIYEADAISFQVVDTLEGDSARGDFGGVYPGVMRPLLPWESERLEP